MASRRSKGNPTPSLMTMLASAVAAFGLLLSLVIVNYPEFFRQYWWLLIVGGLVFITELLVLARRHLKRPQRTKQERRKKRSGHNKRTQRAKRARRSGDRKPPAGPSADQKKPLGHLFGVPPGLPNLTEPPELEELVEALRAGGTGTVGVTTTLAEAGGFGKTSLALLACRDVRVRTHFPGGIMWVTLGEERTAAESAGLLQGWCEALSDQSPQLTDTDSLTRQLADLLSNRERMLLVVDDVWTAEQLEPFVALSEGARLLVTTPNPTALPEGHVLVRVDALDDRAATAMLTRGLPAMDRELREQLLALTGGWPLLLTLLNARLATDVAGGVDVDTAARRAATRLRQAGSSTLDATHADQRSRALQAMIKYSAEALNWGARDRFFELGVFRAGTEIPVSVVQLLWAGTARMQPEQVQQLCETLAGLSLVTLHEVDETRQVVVLHEVVRAFIRSHHGLGDRRRATTNQQLIDQAAETFSIKNEQWWRLPADHFLWDHLAFHMAEGDRQVQLATLVTDVRWALARLAHAGPLALDADLSLSQDPRATATRELITRVGHLLADLESGELSESNRLTHLSALPHIREQLRTLNMDRDPILLTTWPHPAPQEPVAPSSEGQLPSRSRTLDHGNSVWSVAVAPDGAWLASAGDDYTVRLWRADGELISVLDGHTDTVWRVEIAPDSSWFASASADYTVRLWRPNGQPIRTLHGHTDSVWDIAIAPDSSWLASASFDYTVRLWRADGQLTTVLEGHTDMVNAVAIAPDGSWLASVSDDCTVRLWRADGHPIAVLEGHSQAVNEVAIAPDGSWLASAANDHTVRLWRADGEPITVLEGHTEEVDDIAIAPDGAWLASASRDNTVRLWRADGQPMSVLKSHTELVPWLAIAPDSSWLATLASDHTVRLWSPQEPTTCIAAVRLGAELLGVTAAESGLVVVWGDANMYGFEVSRMKS